MGLGRIVASAVLAFGVTSGVWAQQAEAPPPKEYSQQFLVPGSWFHGVHGLAFNKDDQLFAGSVIGQTLYRVQVDSGEVDRVIDPPTGMADDIAFADDGTMAWTAFLIGKVYVRKPNGKTIEVANGMSGPNSLAFGKDGTAVRLRGLPRRRSLRDRHQERRQARLQTAGAQRAAPHRREAGRPQRFRGPQGRRLSLRPALVQGRDREGESRDRRHRGDRLGLQDAGRRQHRSAEPRQRLCRRHRDRRQSGA